jgi:hypothetical protein
VEDKQDPQRLKVLATEKYLDQVRLLTALASALLISPAILLVLLRFSAEFPNLVHEMARATAYLLLSSGSFVGVVVANYFIYSSIVGRLLDDQIDIYRPATRFFSIAQILLLVNGCVFLVLFALLLLRT